MTKQDCRKLFAYARVDDGNLVIGNMLKAAHAIGVDFCYIYRVREVFDTEKGKELLKKWGITGDYGGIGNVTVGCGDHCDPRLF